MSDPRCQCPCHTGEKGFFHCFSPCCDNPDVVSDPPPKVRQAVRIGEFKTITFPNIKSPDPTPISDVIAAIESQTMKRDG